MPIANVVESLPVLQAIVDRLGAGVFVVNSKMEVVLWNNYMATNSQRPASDILGKSLFESFPDLPQAWLERKVRNIFVIKNFSFTSWEQRPYLFRFPHNRPVTGGVDSMRQNCTFFPIKSASGEVEYVCITLFDVTDASIYQQMLQDALRSLAEASNRDGLTNAFNRRCLEETLLREFNRAQRYGGPLAIIMLDLDFFKKVNDTYGHTAGDEVLRTVARCLADTLRVPDFVGRYGGEEFVVILPQTGMDGALVVAERLRVNIAATPVVHGDHTLHVTSSMGVATYHPGLDTHGALIEEADAALYRSKEGGRNRVTAAAATKASGV